jgi:hypothetical protein
MSRRAVLSLLAFLALAGCRGGSGRTDVIPTDRFVAANVALRILPDSAPQADRTAALKKARVTDRQLRAWVTAHARDPEALAKAWEQIATKVDSAAALPVTPDLDAQADLEGGEQPDSALRRPSRDSLIDAARARDSLGTQRPLRFPPPSRPRRKNFEPVQ